MNKIMDFVRKHYTLFLCLKLVLIALLVLIASLIGIGSQVYASNVTDNNRGKEGYILINNGTGQGHQGTWTDIKEVPELKGEKGDKGDRGLQGIQGMQGIQGVAGINGIDGLNGIDGYTPIKGIDYFDGLNGLDGKDGKDFDPIEVTRLDNRIDTSNISITNETSERKNADTKLQNNINTVNSRVDDVSNRVSKLEAIQYKIQTEFRVLDTKRLTVSPYISNNFTRNKLDEVGVRVTIKLGTSYEEREISKTNARLERLERNIGQSVVITKVVDTKGKIKSMSINSTGLSINGNF